MIKNNRTDSNKTMTGKKTKRFNNRERAMFIVVAILIVMLIVKTAFFTEVRGLTEDGTDFKAFVEYTLEEQPQGPLDKLGIIQYRIFDIYIADGDQKSLLRYVDPETGLEVEKILDGRYNARVRKTLLWFFPIKEISITSQIVAE